MLIEQHKELKGPWLVLQNTLGSDDKEKIGAALDTDGRMLIDKFWDHISLRKIFLILIKIREKSKKRYFSDLMKRGTFPVDVSSMGYRTFVWLGLDPDVGAFMKVVCGEHGLSLQVDRRSYDSQQINDHATLRTRLGLQIYGAVQEGVRPGSWQHEALEFV